MKKKLFMFGGLLGVLTLFFWWRWETRIVHLHAGFAVYDNGERINFAEAKYMKLNKCAEENEKEDEQLEKAHLHDNVGEVVHVHRRGATWGDLFKNIEYTFPEKSVVGYINGERSNNVLARQIKAYDNLVIAVGKSNQVNVSGAVSMERIKEVEKMVESCGK